MEKKLKQIIEKTKYFIFVEKKFNNKRYKKHGLTRKDMIINDDDEISIKAALYSSFLRKKKKKGRV